MCEKSEEYIKGYEQGAKDLAERLKTYYRSFSGTTYAVLVAFHVEEATKEMLAKIEKV